MKIPLSPSPNALPNPQHRSYAIPHHTQVHRVTQDLHTAHYRVTGEVIHSNYTQCVTIRQTAPLHGPVYIWGPASLLNGLMQSTFLLTAHTPSSLSPRDRFRCFAVSWARWSASSLQHFQWPPRACWGNMPFAMDSRHGRLRTRLWVSCMNTAVSICVLHVI